jgi:hypothetical protein
LSDVQNFVCMCLFIWGVERGEFIPFIRLSEEFLIPQKALELLKDRFERGLGAQLSYGLLF